jgi:hypothetical protein
MSVTRVADRITRQDTELLQGQSLLIAVTTPGAGPSQGKGARINIVQGLTVRQLTQLRDSLVEAITAEIIRLGGEQGKTKEVGA